LGKEAQKSVNKKINVWEESESNKCTKENGTKSMNIVKGCKNYVT